MAKNRLVFIVVVNKSQGSDTRGGERWHKWCVASLVGPKYWFYNSLGYRNSLYTVFGHSFSKNLMLFVSLDKFIQFPKMNMVPLPFYGAKVLFSEGRGRM